MVRPSVEAASVSIVQGTPEEKRRRGGALQNRADVRGRVEVAIASWSAGVLSRFREGPALSRDRGRLDRPGPNGRDETRRHWSFVGLELGILRFLCALSFEL